MSAYTQGKMAAQTWYENYQTDEMAEEPRNPYQCQPTSVECRQWHVGYAEQVYVYFGDPDRDMEKLERQFGC